MKKIVILLLSALLLFACGCGKAELIECDTVIHNLNRLGYDVSKKSFISFENDDKITYECELAEGCLVSIVSSAVNQKVISASLVSEEYNDLYFTLCNDIFSSCLKGIEIDIQQELTMLLDSVKAQKTAVEKREVSRYAFFCTKSGAGIKTALIFSDNKENG